MDEKRLVMNFKNTLGNSFSITIDDPREDLTEKQVMDAMDLIKTKNLFQPKGYDIVECVSAKVVDSTTIEYDLKV